MITDEMVETVANALQAECMFVFGSTWSNDVARRFARAAIEAALAAALPADESRRNVGNNDA